jgi:hypothetical protein
MSPAPSVGTDVIEEHQGQYFTMVVFSPPNADGAKITLYANFDWWFTLECGRFSLFEDEPMVNDDEDARVALIVNEIESIAVDRLQRSRLDRFVNLGRDRVAPWRA